MNLRQFSAQLLATTVTTLYTSPTDVDSRIDAATLTNNSGVAVTVSVYVGATSSTSTIVLNGKSIPANGSYVVREVIGQSVVSGSSLFAVAGTANVVTLVSSGIAIASS